MSYFDIKIQEIENERKRILFLACQLEIFIVLTTKVMHKLQAQAESFSNEISSLHAIMEEMKDQRNQMMDFGHAITDIVKFYANTEFLLIHPSQETFEENKPMAMTMNDYMMSKFKANDDEFRNKIIDVKAGKLSIGEGLIEWFKYKDRQFGLQMEANTYKQMNKQGITNFTARELQIGEMNNVAGRMALGATAGEIAGGTLDEAISAGNEVKNVAAEESILSKETGEIVKLSSSNIQHIKKHSFEGMKEQAKYLDDAKLAKKIDGNTFFNPKWSQEQIVSNTEKAYNALISEGKTGLQSFNIDGEDIYIFIKSDGTFDTAYGTHILTVKDFR